MTHRCKQVMDIWSWRIWAFISVCFLIAGCSSAKEESTAASDTSPSGKWRAELEQSEGKIAVFDLEFDGPTEFSMNATLHIPKSDGSKEMNEYPGAACDFTYEAPNDTHWTVTMTSKRIEGKERITPEDKTPRQWTCERPSEAELIIKQPRAGYKDGIRELHFHRIDAG